MHGNTRVPTLGTTIRSEARRAIAAEIRGHSARQKWYLTLNYVTADCKPGTLGGMVLEYLQSLSDHECRKIVRESRKEV